MRLSLFLLTALVHADRGAYKKCFEDSGMMGKSCNSDDECTCDGQVCFDYGFQKGCAACYDMGIEDDCKGEMGCVWDGSKPEGEECTTKVALCTEKRGFWNAKDEKCETQKECLDRVGIANTCMNEMECKCGTFCYDMPFVGKGCSICKDMGIEEDCTANEANGCKWDEDKEECAKMEGKMCCKAMTAECLSCAADKTVEEFCKDKPETEGCPDDKMCCKAMTAQCLSCEADKTVEEFCKGKPETEGCPKKETQEECIKRVGIGAKCDENKKCECEQFCYDMPFVGEACFICKDLGVEEDCVANKKMGCEWDGESCKKGETQDECIKRVGIGAKCDENKKCECGQFCYDMPFVGEACFICKDLGVEEDCVANKAMGCKWDGKLCMKGEGGKEGGEGKDGGEGEKSGCAQGDNKKKCKKMEMCMYVKKKCVDFEANKKTCKKFKKDQTKCEKMGCRYSKGKKKAKCSAPKN